MSVQALHAHLAGGLTNVCRCWAIDRVDGVVLGFTDHDRALKFDGITFRPDTGMTARALAQATGLSVDNTEALGVLSDAAITEADIDAGRYDGAGVRAWLVNWRDVGQRMLRFRGSVGEIRRGTGAFEAELRGLTEALNQPQGRVYQRPCTAVLGDAGCGFNLNQTGYFHQGSVVEVAGAQVFRFGPLAGFDPHWFERGTLRVVDGPGQGLSAVIKHDRPLPDGGRIVETWEPIRAEIEAGQVVRIIAGCDKRAETCRLKFFNLRNFRGFPHIPGEDWLLSVPRGSDASDGGSMFR